MDEAVVRSRAEAHGEAVVAGDMKRAGGDLLPAAVAQAPTVMSGMPKPLEEAEVVEARTEGKEILTICSYRGGGSELRVQSRWVEENGEPMIAELQVV